MRSHIPRPFADSDILPHHPSATEICFSFSSPTAPFLHSTRSIRHPFFSIHPSPFNIYSSCSENEKKGTLPQDDAEGRYTDRDRRTMRQPVTPYYFSLTRSTSRSRAHSIRSARRRSSESVSDGAGSGSGCLFSSAGVRTGGSGAGSGPPVLPCAARRNSSCSWCLRR